MSNIKYSLTFEQFKMIYQAIGGEPEFEICFTNKSNEYMIIKYKEGVSFQRCGVTDGSGEIYFDTIDELYSAHTIDNICLRNDWSNIDDIIMDSMYSLYLKEDIIDLCNIYHITL